MSESPVLDLDALVPGSIEAGVLRGTPVTVLGFARTGIALARFFVDAGAVVTIYDSRPESALGDAIAALEGRPVRLRLGPGERPSDALTGAALVVHSPSISPIYPTTEPALRSVLASMVAARAAGDPATPALVSEPDLVLRLCRAPTIGVTGTKGKTTTATLSAAVLAAQPGHPVVLGGNMGDPLIDRIARVGAEQRVVIELSELQLPVLSRGTTVAVYTNVTSDHLDRHGSVESYRLVKRRLAELVDPEGALVLNLDDPVVASYAGIGSAPAVSYRHDRPVPGGVGVVDGWIVGAGVRRLARAAGGPATVGPDGRIMPVDELAVPGAHSLSNAMAAIAVGLLFGVAPDAVRAAVGDFAGIPHRLETVGVVDGVRFVNDSMGTQPDAVIAALEAFEPPIVLIAGGRDKGIDLTALGPAVARRVSAAVLIGESGPALGAAFRAAGLGHVEQSESLEAAVERADAIARELLRADAMPTVLLSPAAASFDMFVDYAARGAAFRLAVAALARRRQPGVRA